MTESPYEMRLSLNVLEHLGINLYSNVPSVLSEVVANSWDADASKVTITFDRSADQIVIQDDGMGMTEAEVNARFLTVGYRRRDKQPGQTAKGRAPMGRKGIGKLSLFSIAECIDVETVQAGEKSAFRMQLSVMRKAIEDDEGKFRPEPLDKSAIDFSHGTRITLSNLKRRQTISTSEGLRKRVARRFSIIGSANDFEIEINGKPITPADRGYLDKIRYLWTYGDQSAINALCVNVEATEDRTAAVEGGDVTLNGWLGTVAESHQLRDDLGENLNRIAIFVRGKMAQEDVLGDFTERGVYATYLIGELHVDDLDKDEGLGGERDEDAATSSRQKIVEDDPRYLEAKRLIGTELKHIQNAWAKLRSEEGAKKALEIPAISEWLEGLEANLRPRARRWLGKINRISVDDPEERRQLWKHSVLAFEFYRWGENLDRLDEIDEANIEGAIELFTELDSLEANLYGQIIRQRVEVIRALRTKVDENALEKVIQRYIFDHLWLLDPAWERVEASEHMETRVEKMFETVNTRLTKEEREGRLDIQYRKTAGKHVIVELKRPDVRVSVYPLAAQIAKYRSAMAKMLVDMELDNEPIEIVCLLGKPPTEWENPDGRRIVEETLRVQQARYVNYDQLLENASQAYSDYMKRKSAVDRLSKIIREIEEYAGPDG
ncbi:MAG: ATP-binding protein [Chloroflexi bacterium]|nr:ATP-binding protein [Chloroflexota bacterium]